MDFEEFLACVENQPILFLGCHLDLFLPGGFLWMLFFLPEDTSEKSEHQIKIFVGDVRGPVSAWRDVNHDFGTIDMITLPHKQKINLEKSIPCFFYHTFSPLLNHTKPPSFPFFVPNRPLPRNPDCSSHTQSETFKLEMSHVLEGPTSNHQMFG